MDFTSNCWLEEANTRIYTEWSICVKFKNKHPDSVYLLGVNIDYKVISGALKMFYILTW